MARKAEEAAHSPSLSESKLFKGRHLSRGFKKEKEILSSYLQGKISVAGIFTCSNLAQTFQ